MVSPSDEIAEMRRDIKELMKAPIPPSPPANHNYINTVFNAGGIGVLVGIAGVFLGLTGMYVINDRAESRMAIMVAERKADLREISTLKRDVVNLQAYTTLHGQKITKLEAQNGVETERR